LELALKALSWRLGRAGTRPRQVAGVGLLGQSLKPLVGRRAWRWGGARAGLCGVRGIRVFPLFPPGGVMIFVSLKGVYGRV